MKQQAGQTITQLLLQRNMTRTPNIIQAMKYKKNIFIEKPMAINSRKSMKLKNLFKYKRV